MTYDSYQENQIHCAHDSILTLLKQLASYEKIRRQIYSIPLSIRRRVIEYTPGAFTLLMNAAHVDRSDVVELLLLEGANPNEENAFGYTAFSYTRRSDVIGMLHAFSNMRWLGDITFGTIEGGQPTLNVRWNLIKEKMINHLLDEITSKYMKSRDNEVFRYILDFHRHVTLSDVAYHSIKNV